jgi:DNA-binding NarL/FixJ family response regulator
LSGFSGPGCSYSRIDPNGWLAMGMSALLTRILLADDFSAVRRGVRAILESRDDFKVVAEAEDGVDALEQAQKVHPDLAVVDISMPRMNGLELTREIRRTLPDTEILILTQHNSHGVLEKALEAGARGYVVKSAVAADLINAVESVRAHRQFASSCIE